MLLVHLGGGIVKIVQLNLVEFNQVMNAVVVNMTWVGNLVGIIVRIKKIKIKLDLYIKIDIY